MGEFLVRLHLMMKLNFLFNDDHLSILSDLYSLWYIKQLYAVASLQEKRAKEDGNSCLP